MSQIEFYDKIRFVQFWLYQIFSMLYINYYYYFIIIVVVVVPIIIIIIIIAIITIITLSEFYMKLFFNCISRGYSDMRPLWNILIILFNKEQPAYIIRFFTVFSTVA